MHRPSLRLLSSPSRRQLGVAPPECRSQFDLDTDDQIDGTNRGV
jgi:hypothetical protein